MQEYAVFPATTTLLNSCSIILSLANGSEENEEHAYIRIILFHASRYVVSDAYNAFDNVSMIIFHLSDS